MGVYNYQIGAQDDRPRKYHHCVLGYRGWSIYRPTDDSPVRLRSPHLSCVWDQAEMSARCLQWPKLADPPRRKKIHRAPHQECSCGYYGYYDPFDNRSHGSIRGAIAASGTVQVHADGFRAEKVRILALALPLGEADMPVEELEAQERVIREIAAFYGVPALEPAELEAYCTEHATHVPTEYRPERKPPPTQAIHTTIQPRSRFDLDLPGILALGGIIGASLFGFFGRGKQA